MCTQNNPPPPQENITANSSLEQQDFLHTGFNLRPWEKDYHPKPIRLPAPPPPIAASDPELVAGIHASRPK